MCSGGEDVSCAPPELTNYMWERILAPLRLLVAGFFVAGFLLLLLVFPRGRLGLVAICNHLHFSRFIISCMKCDSGKLAAGQP